MRRSVGFIRALTVLAGAAILLPAMMCGASDTLTLTDKSVFRGTFKRFKSDRFYFESETGKDINERRPDVRSLTLEPSSKATVKLRGQKKDEGFVLMGYRDGKFQVTENGKPASLAAGDITVMEMGFDSNRTLESSTATIISKGEVVDFEKMLATGMVTVVHFHSPNVLSSVRQGTYMETLARDRNGQVTLLRVEVPEWNAPVARQYGIVSAPQFWFYNDKGRLVAKLSERFTDADLETALRRAEK